MPRSKREQRHNDTERMLIRGEEGEGRRRKEEEAEAEEEEEEEEGSNGKTMIG